MGIMDNFRTGETSNTAQGVNNIPAPRSDANVNAPPPEQHKRVLDFVRVRILAPYLRRRAAERRAELRA
jgi:hypothetical protein